MARPTDPVTEAIYQTARAARQCRSQLDSQPALQRLYRFILEAFAATGRPPDPGRLDAAAAAIGCSLMAALSALASLDLLALREGPDPLIRVAYPFSADPTPHRVAFDDVSGVYAVCALDALGIPLMLDRDVAISSAEPIAAHPIRVRVRRGRATWHPSASVLFIAPVQGCGPAADCACRAMNFFTSRPAAAEWAVEHGPGEGWILDQEQALTRAGLVFADLLRKLPEPPCVR